MEYSPEVKGKGFGLVFDVRVPERRKEIAN
jgi:hypothetical protein